MPAIAHAPVVLPAAPPSLAIRTRVKRPGAATFGWFIVGLSLLWIVGAAGTTVDAAGQHPQPPGEILAGLAIGFAAFAVGWRMGRERRPVGPMVWLSRLVNVPGLVDSVRSTRPVWRGPSAMRDRGRARNESRNAALGVAAGLAWLLAGVAAVRLEIRWFPPLSSQVFLALGTAAATLAGAVLPMAMARRGLGTFRLAPVAAAIVLPLLAVAIVPAFGPLRTTPLPGRRMLAATAWPTGQGELYLVRGGGARIEQLTHDGTAVGGADLSPDGRHVVFGDRRAGTLDLWLMDLDATGRPAGTRRLTDGSGDEAWPRWSPDGRSVAYVVEEDGTSNIEVIDVASGETKQVTDDGHARDPSWSSDGSEIVYASIGSDNPTFDIWGVLPDGTGAHDMLDSGGNDLDPFLSPDDSTLLFSSDRSGSYDVWVAGVNEGGERSLTPGEKAVDRAIGWSPDGRFAFFTSNRSDAGGNFVFFVPAGGGPATLAIVI